MALFGKKDWGIDELTQFYQLELPDINGLARGELAEWVVRVSPSPFHGPHPRFSGPHDGEYVATHVHAITNPMGGLPAQLVGTHMQGNLAPVLGPLAVMHRLFVRVLDTVESTKEIKEADRLALNDVLRWRRKYFLNVNGKKVSTVFPLDTPHSVVNTIVDGAIHGAEILLMEEADDKEMPEIEVSVRLKEQMVKVLEDPTLLARCPVCQSVFVRRRSDQKYCSRRCTDRIANRHLRQRGKKMLTANESI